mgnify:CR=1 FL=1
MNKANHIFSMMESFLFLHPPLEVGGHHKSSCCSTQLKIKVYISTFEDNKDDMKKIGQS